MSGGYGNDIYHVDNINDTVTEQWFEGTDTIYSSVSYTAPTNVENLTLTGYGNNYGFGNNSGQYPDRQQWQQPLKRWSERHATRHGR